MKTLIMTRGLPASGKSTWATAQVLKAGPGQMVRINKDLLRTMLHADRFHGKNESQIIKARNMMLEKFLQDGVSVIVDDTNLNPTHEATLRDLAKKHKAQFQIKDFTDVTVEECIKRDLKRTASVGQAVIQEMYNKFLKPAALPAIKPTGPAPKAILVDIDGTIAIHADRDIMDFTKVSQDLPNTPVIEVVKALHAAGNTVIYMSGRDDSCKKDTLSWIEKHVGITGDLHMRVTGDYRKDSVVKHELFMAHVANNFDITVVIDDRDQVVNMWRDQLGLTCLQVAPGNF